MRRARCVILCMACAVAGMLHAQAGKTIVIKLRDGKTGESVTPSNLQVRFNHQAEASGQWTDQKDDGSTEVKLPDDAKSVSVRASYLNSLEYYVNCDVAKQRNTSGETWYPIDEILSSGISAPNDCVKPKPTDKVKVDAKPGEFVLYVRKRNWKEQVTE
jgi:hypothetical protein